MIAPRRQLRTAHALRLAMLLTSTALVGVPQALAQTLPTNGQVAAGNATIDMPSNGSLTINQSSQSAVLNWQSFSIGQGNTVTINQPSATAAILNRVTGSTPSTIAGQINAIGQVYLVNPNGIAITATGTVNTAGFVASTLGISDDDFMGGKRGFTGTGASAKVTNHGIISIGRGGYAALIGGAVDNAGIIAVPLGKVGLGSGERATLDLSGDGFMQVAIPTAAAGNGALVSNSGTILTGGGMVLLSAATARDMARQAINMSGTIEAKSVAGRNGMIVLAGADGDVAVSGKLDATGGTGVGGAITITGRNIELTGAALDASGETGGGTIHIGGDWHGSGTLQRADAVEIDSRTAIKADATSTGNGGNIAVWSDQRTDFAGQISARGGAISGNGGAAEVSGKAMLDYTGFANLTAVNGNFGNLLLDPYNVVISNAANNTAGSFIANTNDSIINAATLSSQLGGANVTVTTGSAGAQAGTITVTAPVSWAAPTILTLTAANAIAINAAINVQGTGGVVLNVANDTTTLSGTSIPKLSFGAGASVDYGATNQGGTLSINGNSYALLYSLTDFFVINGAGRSALATDITSTNPSSAPYVSTFTGIFEGLGHSLSNLTIISTTPGSYVGLFGRNFGQIRNFNLVGGSIMGAAQSYVGAIAGELADNAGVGAVFVNVTSSAAVRGGDAARVGGLVGNIQSSSGGTLIYNSSASGAVTTGNATGQVAYAGGLVGLRTTSAPSIIIGSHASGNVSGGSSATLGGLVAQATSTGATSSIVNSYATGTVGPVNPGVAVNVVGGLVGFNNADGGTASISGSFATGAVSGGNGANGGLVGVNSVSGTNNVASITNSYATGAVSGNSGSRNGGLVGSNQAIFGGNTASISTSYATGRVTGNNNPGGGLIGIDQRIAGGNTAVMASYWDTSTSGIPAAGIADDANGQSAGVTGLTTAQFQNGSLPASFSSSVWATGAGLYPYLTGIFAVAPQVISGFAYSDAGLTGLASGTSGAVTIGIIANSAKFASATTGANGYYYAFAPAATAANGAALLAYTAGGPPSAATQSVITNPALQTGLNLYGSALTVPTAATSLSTAPDLAQAQASATAIAGGNTAALAAINGAIGRGIVASGANFTIDQTVGTSRAFFVQTTAANAGITVSSAIDIANGGGLGLLASGALAVNAPVTANGTATVNLAYNASTPGNLSFAIGAPLNFTGAGGLAINGQGYTLISSLIGLQNINNDLNGHYALAVNIDASATVGWNGGLGFTPLGTDGFSSTLNNFNGFNGAFTGLGHTIDSLSVNRLSIAYIGLFGVIGTSGLVQNVGVTNATIRGLVELGVIAGSSDGTVTQSYATGQLFTTQYGSVSGGLIGYNVGILSQSFSTVAVNARDTNTGGGAVGYNTGTIDRVYAMGAVDIGSGGASAGGLVGYNSSGTIIDSYATGAVSGSTNVGGFVGTSFGGTVSGAFDTTTSGNGLPGSGNSTSGGTVVGLSTASFQNGGAGGLSSAFGGGAGGLYPFLNSFYPDGVQAISGIAYQDAGVTLLTSGVRQPIYVPSPGYVSAAVGGVALGTVTTGANGYYYIALPGGRLATSQAVLVYTQADPSGSGARNAATIGTSPGGSTVANVDVYGGTITQATPAMSVSTEVPLADMKNTANAVAGNVASALSTINAINGLGFIALGASFDVDTVSGLDTLYVRTAASAPITVSTAVDFAANGGGLGLFSGGAISVGAPVTLRSGGLALNAATTLAINAPVQLNGAVAASLAAGLDTTTLANNLAVLRLSFGGGSGLSFNNAGGSTASTSQGGTLAINGLAYKLLYSLADIDGIDGIAAVAGGTINDQIADGGLSGRYALAHDLVGATIYNDALVGTNSTDDSTTRFSGIFEGLGHSITDLTIDKPGDFQTSRYAGLFGYVESGTVRDIGLIGGSVSAVYRAGALVGYTVFGTIAQTYATGTVSGLYSTGGLVGENAGTIIQGYATGNIAGSTAAGGLVGLNRGTITQAYATGGVAGYSAVGGLVGDSRSGQITLAFAMGAVSGDSYVGGFAGYNAALIQNAFSTGRVTGNFNLSTGGFSGGNDGTLVQSYFDTQTSGLGISYGGTGRSTAQLQNGNLAFLSFDTNFWAGGTDGLYPYLASFFPGGVQAISGTVYRDAGLTPLASGANGAVTVGVVGNGTIFGTATTGANGYYYVFGAAGSVAASATLLGYTNADIVTGAKNAATLSTLTNTTAHTGLDIYGDALTIPTAATSLSAAPTLAQAQASTMAAAGGNAAALAAVNGATGRGFFASDVAGFTIDQPLVVPTGSTFLVKTITAAAPITVSKAITTDGTASLGLLSSGALVINAPIAVVGAGAVNFAFDTSSLTNLSFAIGASVDYGASANGGKLAINGASYSLLYDMAAVAGVNADLTGKYALATNLDASGIAYATGIIAGGDASGASPTQFSGIFDGLGHSIANLAIAGGSNNYVGLIGFSNGIVRDIGLIGGGVSGNIFLGGLVGLNDGTIVHAYNTGTVTGNTAVGGVVGQNNGIIASAFATGAVSGTNAVGGFVGINAGSIARAYATGAVNGVSSLANYGGFAGYNIGTIAQAYATGSVNGASRVGGFVGLDYGTVQSSYYDTSTGLGLGSGDGNNTAIGLATEDFQSGNAIGLGGAFAGGAGGLYPYLASFYPNGVQAISGFAYSDLNDNRLASGAGGAVMVNLIGGGTAFGMATTGANGYYYIVGAPGAIANGAALLAYVAAPTAATLTAADGTVVNGNSSLQTHVNLYRAALKASTSDITLSAADVATIAAATVAANGDSAAQTAITGATGRYYTAAGASFTIDQNVNTFGVFAVSTLTGAPLTVTNAIAIGTGGSLGLFSGGALAINAPVTANGAVAVRLTAGLDPIPGNLLPFAPLLTFGNATGLTFANADGTAANETQGGALAINAQNYTLLYNLASSGQSNAVQDIDLLGTGGFYALATNLTGTQTFTSALAGVVNEFSGVFEGLGHVITNLRITDLTPTYVGLFSINSGSIRDIGLVGGAVTGGISGIVGALAGNNHAPNPGMATIVNAFSSATVTGGESSIVGGLVGTNQALSGSTAAIIANSYATGAVRGGDNATIGGLAGNNLAIGGLAVITNSYATGAVTLAGNTGTFSTAGGLVGENTAVSLGTAAIFNSFATGAVSVVQGNIGGVVGTNLWGLLDSVFWDLATSGVSDAVGSDNNNQIATSLTTTQFQDGASSLSLGGGFVTSSGLYPYLASFFPGGVQAVSGFAYRDAGTIALASGAKGAVAVNIIGGGGSILAPATTGANGYYYAFGQSGSIANGADLLAYITGDAATDAKSSVTLATLSNTPNQTGINLYNGALSASTSAQTLSAAESAIVAAINTAATGNLAAQVAVIGAAGRYYTATGASFMIDRGINTPEIFAVSTLAGAPLTVSNPITINAGGSLGLLSGGALTIDAPIVINGAVAVLLGFDSALLTNFSVARGASIDYGPTNQGGTLGINNQSYALLYSMTDVELQAANGKNAIATNIDAAASSYTSAVVGSFSGTLEGLGHSISNLTITGSSDNVGLIGELNAGLVRNIGLVGGSFSGHHFVGSLVGSNQGAIVNSYSTSAVSGGNNSFAVGGLVGGSYGTITQSFALGAVSSGDQSNSVGGLAGTAASGTISQSYATGAVSGGIDSNYVGGFVGENGGTIGQSYATGAVSGGINSSYVGGFVGGNAGTIDQSYATGAVSGTFSLGGFAGVNYNTITDAYYDAETTGQSLGAQADGSFGLTTNEFQNQSQAASLGVTFAGGAGGLYPYLTNFFPNGVQVVSGFAYTDGGVTPLASSANGAAYVSIASNGQTRSSVTTGANGYYYAFVQRGALTTSLGVAAYTQANVATGALDGVSYVVGTSGIVTNLDISGGWRRDTTSRPSLMQVDTRFVLTTGGTPVSGFTLPNRSIVAINDLELDKALSVTGTLSLSSLGDVTQTAAFSANTLILGGANSFTLIHTDNSFSRFTAVGGAIDIYDAGGLMIAASASDACGCTYAGVFTTGPVRIATAGDLTIESGAGIVGTSPILATDGAFINNEGAAAVTAITGNWLIYSATSAGDILGNLDSGNTAIWNTTAGTAVITTGNRYIFAESPILTVTANDEGKTYGDVSGLNGYTITGLRAGVSGAYLGDTLGDIVSGTAAVASVGAAATANVGDYAITASPGSLASTGYNFSFIDGTLTVAPRALSITADALSRIYGNANPALTYASSGLVNGDSLTGGLTTTAGTTSGIGSYAITQGNLAASPNYTLIYTGANLAITPRALSVAADALSRNYGNANPALTYASIGLVNGDVLTGGLATGAGVTSGIGNYAVAQGNLAPSANYTLTYTGANLTVTPRALNITADGLLRIYGNANPALTYTSIGLVNGDTLSGGLATVAGVTSGIGNYAITQGNVTASANYSLTYTGANLIVTPRALSITADALSRIYGNANPAFIYASIGLVNGDALTGGLATGASATSGIGNYAITQGNLAASANYSLTYTGANLVITPRALSIAADAFSRIYGNANPAFTYASTGLVNGDALTGGLATGAGVTSGIGSYAITQGNVAASANYMLTYTGANLAITPRALSITADAFSRIYGNANPAFTYASTGLVNGDALTGGLATGAGVTSGIGSYAITQGNVAASANYMLTYAGANLAIIPRALSITADALSRGYGNANPALTYASNGLVNGDTLSGNLATSAAITSGIGNYAVTQGNLAASTNYTLMYVGANLVITPRVLSITADALSRIYGNANPALTYASIGLVNGDIVTGGLTTVAGVTSGIGNYAVTQGNLTATSNYTLTYTDANIAITPRALSIAANALSRSYGDANPALSYASIGLVNGDALTGGLATSAAATSGIGNYAVTQGNLAASANYTLTYTGANLVITPRALSITADAISRAFGNANPALTYAAGSRGLVNGDILSGTLATGADTTSSIGGYAITQGNLAASANYNLTFVPGTLTVTASAIANLDTSTLASVIAQSWLVGNPVVASILPHDPATTGTDGDAGGNTPLIVDPRFDGVVICALAGASDGGKCVIPSE